MWVHKGTRQTIFPDVRYCGSLLLVLIVDLEPKITVIIYFPLSSGTSLPTKILTPSFTRSTRIP